MLKMSHFGLRKKKAEPESETQAKEAPKKKKKFHLKGMLYREFAKKPEQLPATRIGQMLRIKRYETDTAFRLYPMKRLISLSGIKEVKTKGMMYQLIKPYAYASIKYEPIEGTMVYNVIEPNLNESEKKALEAIKAGLRL